MVSGPCVTGSLSPTNLTDQSEATANDPKGTPIFVNLQIGTIYLG